MHLTHAANGTAHDLRTLKPSNASASEVQVPSRIYVLLHPIALKGPIQGSCHAGSRGQFQYVTCLATLTDQQHARTSACMDFCIAQALHVAKTTRGWRQQRQIRELNKSTPRWQDSRDICRFRELTLDTGAADMMRAVAVHVAITPPPKMGLLKMGSVAPVPELGGGPWSSPLSDAGGSSSSETTASSAILPPKPSRNLSMFLSSAAL